MKMTEKQRSAGVVGRKRSRDEERRMDRLIDELCGCLTEGDALAELEHEHRAEVLSDAHRHS